MKRKKGYFSISAVAQMFSVHQQTIRLYEKEGFISPKRSEGNTRLFSEQDINKLEEIIYLTHQLGINLAGVEMIIKLQKKIEKLQYEINNLFSAAQAELSNESNLHTAKAQENAQNLARMQKIFYIQDTLQTAVESDKSKKNKKFKEGKIPKEVLDE